VFFIPLGNLYFDAIMEASSTLDFSVFVDMVHLFTIFGGSRISNMCRKPTEEEDEERGRRLREDTE